MLQTDNSLLWDEYELRTDADLDAIDQLPLVLPHRYAPWEHQEELLNTFFDMLELFNEVRRYCICWHRRAGKDVTFFQCVVAAAAQHRGDYCYMLPKQTQAKKVVWNGNVEDSNGLPCNFADFIPPDLLAQAHKADMRYELTNGSNIYVSGSDNYDNLVGMNARGVVFSEWALCDPLAYEFFAPMLRKNKGWAMFCFTPRGKNHAYATLTNAEKEGAKNRWYVSRRDITKTRKPNGEPIISKQDIKEELEDGADPDIVRQEYFLDFNAAVKGIIYGKEMEKCREEGRVKIIPVNPDVPVVTWWDIGVSDETSIWYMQPEPGTNKLNLIGYYENSGEGLEHYVRHMAEFKERRGFKQFGTVHFPHDGRVQEFITGKRRHEAMMEYGFDVNVIPRTQDLWLGIRQTRNIFNRFVFDEKECFFGIQCMENYRRKVNKVTKVLGDPLHDTFSNGADALRQCGQFYADKYIDKSYDKEHMEQQQHIVNVMNGDYDAFGAQDDYDAFEGY